MCACFLRSARPLEKGDSVLALVPGKFPRDAPSGVRKRRLKSVGCYPSVLLRRASASKPWATSRGEFPALLIGATGSIPHLQAGRAPSCIYFASETGRSGLTFAISKARSTSSRAPTSPCPYTRSIFLTDSNDQPACAAIARSERPTRVQR